MAKIRARVIDDDVIEVVLELLKNWTGKLTWDLLILQIKQGIGVLYTRQALSAHEALARAFTSRKLSLRKEAEQPAPLDNRVDTLQKTVARLKAENELLKTECNNYRAMFIVWTANAVKKGITEKMLSAPLLPAMRPSTDDREPSFRPAVVRRKFTND
jgi:hypothetical protein